MALNRPAVINTAIAIISLVAAVVLCEALVRRIDGYVVFRLDLFRDGTVRSTSDSKSLSDYARRLPIPPNVKLSWFDETPPLPIHRPDIKELDEMSNKAGGDAVLRKEGRRIWNENYVYESIFNNLQDYTLYFTHFSDGLFVFDPGKETIYPRYRLYPNDGGPEGILPPNSGMTVNNLGYRGPDVPIIRKSRTIRIAFIGASTTIESAGRRLGYPEYTVFWLNKWAQEKGLDITFESINAGREAFNTYDMVEVVASELLKLKPDLVVFMEGANQFYWSFHEMVKYKKTARIYEREKYDFPADRFDHKILRLSALARRVALVGHVGTPGFAAEREKPPYELRFPRQVDEMNPDIEAPGLPLDLTNVFANLDRIRADLNTIDSDLVVSTFVWLAYDGMLLDRSRHKSTYWYLNGSDVTWPLTYGDLRRLADFQNVALKKYGERKAAGVLDLARYFPMDPDLMLDAIHKNDDGIRLAGWIAFIELLPIIKQRLADGRLPRFYPESAEPDRRYDDIWPFKKLSLADIVRDVMARRASQTLESAEQIDIRNLALDYDKAKVEGTGPVTVTTAPESHAYAATLAIPENFKAFANCDIRIVMDGLVGSVNFGVLSADRHRFLVSAKAVPEIVVGAEHVAMTMPIRLRIPDMHDASTLMVANNQPQDGVRSVVTISNVTIGSCH